MKYFASFGHNEFIICAGYKQYVIKEFFSNYYLHTSDVTFDFNKENEIVVHSNHSEPWKVTVVDTGLNTMTGGRLRRIRDYLGDKAFFMTYGDGLSNVNLTNLLDFHHQNNNLATLTAIQPGGRFGTLEINDKLEVTQFREKSKDEGGWINGGFMVLDPKVINYISSDNVSFERDPLEKLVSENELNAYKHHGFWQCMDTLRDKEILENLWRTNKAPWKVWSE
jgi:glucose-1-phosphate cytidylyltransferase